MHKLSKTTLCLQRSMDIGDAIGSRLDLAEKTLQSIDSDNKQLRQSITEYTSKNSTLEKTNPSLLRQVNIYGDALKLPLNMQYAISIERIKSILQTLTISSAHPIKIAGWDIQEVYSIGRPSIRGASLSTDLISFAPTAYTIPNGIDCMKARSVCDDLCKLVELAVLTFKQQKTVEEYKVAYDNFVVRHKPDGVYWDEDVMAVMELTVLARIMREISDDAHLFLRGTADGEKQEWKQPLVKG
jgi:hypothetical protein